MQVMYTQSELREHDHRVSALFHCSRCGKDNPTQHEGGTGYAYDEAGKPLCYQCCGEVDQQAMRKTGRATLYLSRNPNGGHQVGNWPGTLRIPVGRLHTGRHNIAGTRTDVWFMFDNQTWHGTQYGENTQLCHCKRVQS